MRFLRRLLEPSYSRQADFDSFNSQDENETYYSFLCSNCSARVSFPFAEPIRHDYTWENHFDQTTVSAIKEYFEMNLVGKSPDGGRPSIFTVDCNCHTRFMVYSGVKETYNSAYRVVIQSIAEIAHPE